MQLLDFDVLSDVDLSEMMDRGIPCQTGELSSDKTPLPGCTGTATHWMNITCRRCGDSDRIVTCFPCTRKLFIMARIVTSLAAWTKYFGHEGCRRPYRYRVTTGAL